MMILIEEYKSVTTDWSMSSSTIVIVGTDYAAAACPHHFLLHRIPPPPQHHGSILRGTQHIIQLYKLPSLHCLEALRQMSCRMTLKIHLIVPTT